MSNLSCICLCGAMRSASPWTSLMHCVACSLPACAIVGRHIGSGAARWLPWEPSNIPRQIPDVAIKRNFNFTYLQPFNADIFYIDPMWGCSNLWRLHCIYLQKSMPSVTQHRIAYVYFYLFISFLLPLLFCMIYNTVKFSINVSADVTFVYLLVLLHVSPAVLYYQ